MILHTDNLPDIIAKSLCVFDGGYVLIPDEYSIGLCKLMDVSEINEEDFMCICSDKFFFDYKSELEKYALLSHKNSFWYARYVLKGRFELGEPIISTDALFSYNYARVVLKGRFELGEETIATDAHYSYYYAKEVLRGIFELGEYVILNSEYKDDYSELFS